MLLHFRSSNEAENKTLSSNIISHHIHHLSFTEHCPGFDPGVNEPALEAAWLHLQLVYESPDFYSLLPYISLIVSLTYSWDLFDLPRFILTRASSSLNTLNKIFSDLICEVSVLCIQVKAFCNTSHVLSDLNLSVQIILKQLLVYAILTILITTILPDQNCK